MLIEKIVVHCSDSPQGRGDDAETIHQWHLERGWSGCGYHCVILEDGTLQPGRPDYWQGSHVRGHNKTSLGVCLIGMGGDATEAQLSSLKMLITGWCHKFDNPEVLGHCDLDPHKTCPGFNVAEWWESVK